MLLSTMNISELSNEILRDYQNLMEKTVPRLGKEYSRERHRLKISSKNFYSKTYTVKTFYKNKWTVIFSKDEVSSKLTLYTYYYTNKGLRVFKVMEHSSTIYVYNGHLFQRYNQRLNLGLTSILDSVNHFFINNPYRIGRLIKKDDQEYFFDVCQNGILLGSLDLKNRWIILKTFISRELVKEDQTELEIKMIEKLSEEIKFELSLNPSELTGNKTKVLNSLLN